MITRSKCDSNYEFMELPSTKKRKTQTECTLIQKPLYDVFIDFDEAHFEWMKNKVKLPDGNYKYKRERGKKREDQLIY